MFNSLKQFLRTPKLPHPLKPLSIFMNGTIPHPHLSTPFSPTTIVLYQSMSKSTRPSTPHVDIAMLPPFLNACLAAR